MYISALLGIGLPVPSGWVDTDNMAWQSVSELIAVGLVLSLASILASTSTLDFAVHWHTIWRGTPIHNICTDCCEAQVWWWAPFTEEALEDVKTIFILIPCYRIAQWPNDRSILCLIGPMQMPIAVQWYFYQGGYYIALLMKEMLQCVPIPNQLQYLDILPNIFLTLGTLCLSAVLIMDCLYRKWLDTNNKTGNPIKLIFQVLNYARKNKYPRLRSALTYIDEEHPSRIDFGKHKFGGPFTEEAVEDVKTIFRLIPLLLSATSLMYSSSWSKWISCIMFFRYGLYVDVPLPLSQLVSLGSNK